MLGFIIGGVKITESAEIQVYFLFTLPWYAIVHNSRRYYVLPWQEKTQK